MRDKIKIAHVVLSLNYGGTEKNVLTLVNNLDKNEFDCSIVCLDTCGRMVERVDESVRIYEVKRQPGLKVSNVLSLYQTLTQIQPHIVHFRNFTTYFWGCVAAMFQKNCIIVYSDHGNIAAHIEGENRKAIFVRKVLRYFTHYYLTNSVNFESMLSKKVGLKYDDIKVIENSVDPDTYHPLGRKAKESLRVKLGFSSGDYIIGIVASLRPVKNISLIIKILPRVISVLPNAKLVIVGEGNEKGDLVRLASSLGVRDKVVFLGLREEINEVLNTFDVFVFPSAYGEGMPNAVLEAMAARIPVVASDISGNVEILGNGKRGILFQNRDEDSFLHSLLKVASNKDLSSEVAERGYHYVKEYLKPSDMIQKYGMFYRSVFTRGRVKSYH